MALDAQAAAGPGDGTMDLLVPGMSCAGCMSKIERTLMAVGGVTSARANLTQHRVRVVTEGELEPEALVAALSQVGYEARPFDATLTAVSGEDKAGRDLLLRLGVAGFAAMNVMLLSVSVWSGAEATTRDLFHWVSALIALPAMAYSGMPFFRSAGQALRARSLNMDVPISLAILLSAVSSVIETSRSGEHAYFDAGIMLIFFLLIGRYLDHRTRTVARSAAAELAAMTGRTVMRVFEDGRRALCRVEDVEPGMLIEIAPGERVPADACITSGMTDLDRALITGEATPEPAGEGVDIHAGVLNLTGAITARVTATGDATLLAEIARMVDAAERGRGRYDRLADRAARLYSPLVHALAAIAFAGWYYASGDLLFSLGIATALLIITCPCALGLAIPTVHTVATTRLFRSGIFLKDGAELERLAEIDMVVFDKTGTLTDGLPGLSAHPDPDSTTFRVAAALACKSHHPASRAITEMAQAEGTALPPIDRVHEIPGYGVEGMMDGQRVRLGRPDWVGIEEGCNLAVQLADGSTAGFSLAETLRPGTAETCAELAALGCELAILSGDSAPAVDRVAQEAGIATAHAALKPADKLRWLDQWRAEGRRVLMVGDGLNDSPALAAAHASMSPSSAADVSKMAAGLVFTGAALAPVAEALRIARAARRRSLESFGLAAVYNAIAVPIAMAGLVTPLIAALAMSGSSVLVILNALRLRRSR